MRQARREAAERLRYLVDPNHDDCLATAAMSEESGTACEDPEDTTSWKIWDPVCTVLEEAGAVPDDRPCRHCRGKDR